MPCGKAFAQHGIGTSNPSLSAALDITSSNRGFLLPRVALQNINSLLPIVGTASAEQNGLIVYNTSNNLRGEGLYYYDWSTASGSGSWKTPLSSLYNQDGSLSGNRIIRIPQSLTISLTGNAAFRISTANQPNGFVYVDGANNRLGIGTSTPTALLDARGGVRLEQLPVAPHANTFNRFLTGDANGNLAGFPVATFLSSANQNSFYFVNGTLTGNRVVTAGTQNLSFVGSSTLSIASPTLYFDLGAARVGIGTTTPTHALTVAGHLRAHSGVVAQGFSMEHPTQQHTVQVPTPNAAAAFASNTNAGSTAGGAFDGAITVNNNANRWANNNSAGAAHIGYNFGTGNARTVTAYRFYRGGQAGFYPLTDGLNPEDFELQGSNTGITWTTLHAVTGYGTANYNTNKWHTFTVTAPGSYTQYRLRITKKTGSATNVHYVAIEELQFFEAERWTFTRPAADVFLLQSNRSTRDIINADLNGDIVINGGYTGAAGNVSFEVNGSFVSNTRQVTSDRRFKKNIRDLHLVLADVLQLRGKAYAFRQGAFPALAFPSGRQAGLIAQEVEQAFPELVTAGQGPQGYKSVDYTRLSVVLLAAYQAQQRRLEAQEKRLERLVNHIQSKQPKP